MNFLCDENHEPLVVYHGTRADFEQIDTSHTVDGGLHFGSQDQARMRCGKKGRLVAANIRMSSARRCRDQGGNWKKRIAQAKSAGHDAIVYLNRYEGIPFERVDQAFADGIDLDGLTDAQFRKLIPEARDSWIVFCVEQVRLVPEVAAGNTARRPRP